MPATYKVVERKNVIDKTKPSKFYPSAVKTGAMTNNALCKRIEQQCTACSGDVKLVVDRLLVVLKEELVEGRSVHLDDFGTFRLSFASRGSETADKVTANNIGRKRVIFTPCVEMKSTMQQAKFERRITDLPSGGATGGGSGEKPEEGGGGFG